MPGMTEDDVAVLLGEPESKESPTWLASALGLFAPREEAVTMLYAWRYGRLPLSSPALPADYEFIVYFRNGRAVLKADPFNGPASKSGVPARPELIYPKSGEVYDHYPRVIDFRWQPSLGELPIIYCVQVDLGKSTIVEEQDGSESLGNHFLAWKAVETPIPYISLAMPGKQVYRWRVCATNQLSDSKWTEWRDFRFVR